MQAKKKKEKHFFWRVSPSPEGPCRAQIETHYRIRHISGLEMTSWRNSIMILHGFSPGAQNQFQNHKKYVFT